MEDHNSVVIDEILLKVGLEPIGSTIRKIPIMGLRGIRKKALPRKKEIKEAPLIKPESHNI